MRELIRKLNLRGSVPGKPPEGLSISGERRGQFSRCQWRELPLLRQSPVDRGSRGRKPSPNFLQKSLSINKYYRYEIFI